mmetsp:Transcript_2778/g.5729  ORF Transcript_2778/g.5729 Transcript_2778/m.5729 type:complete len:110 (-) Transcript_2778:600-929(-)|eukprot:6202635-Pleurochrysis_carterae.AAC.1
MSCTSTLTNKEVRKIQEGGTYTWDVGIVPAYLPAYQQHGFLYGAAQPPLRASRCGSLAVPGSVLSSPLRARGKSIGATPLSSSIAGRGDVRTAHASGESPPIGVIEYWQ